MGRERVHPSQRPVMKAPISKAQPRSQSVQCQPNSILSPQAANGVATIAMAVMRQSNLMFPFNSFSPFSNNYDFSHPAQYLLNFECNFKRHSSHAKMEALYFPSLCISVIHRCFPFLPHPKRHSGYSISVISLFLLNSDLRIP